MPQVRSKPLAGPLQTVFREHRSPRRARREDHDSLHPGPPSRPPEKRPKPPGLALTILVPVLNALSASLSFSFTLTSALFGSAAVGITVFALIVEPKRRRVIRTLPRSRIGRRSGKARRPIYRGRSPYPADGVSGSSRSRNPSVHRERFFGPTPQTSSTAITP